MQTKRKKLKLRIVDVPDFTNMPIASKFGAKKVTNQEKLTTD
jgi:hypothetical protein